MGKAKSDVQAAKANAKVRAIQQQQRQRVQWTVGIVALVVVGVALLVLVKISTSDKKEAAVSTRKPASASLVKHLADVPLDTIVADYKRKTADKSSGIKELEAIDAPALTQDGKPHVIYVGAEYCPYCAGERWALVTALSHFGSFEGLNTVTAGLESSAAISDLPTLSFYESTFTSKYLSFTGRETQDRHGNALSPMTEAEEKMFTEFNAPPYVSGNGGGIPFINFGGKYLQAGASYGPQSLKGKTQDAIAEEIATGDSDLAVEVRATAGTFIKAICSVTDGEPGDVCKPFAS